MRAWFLLLLLPLAQGALLEDGTGDVAIDTCNQAQTPVQGFDAMDVTALDVNETPDEIVFTVTAAGLEDEAGPDAGNYFVHMRRGDVHYALRMFQDNAGTGAIAQMIQTEGVSLFGPTIAELPADIDGATHSISTAVPRDLLLDQDGSFPVQGQNLDDLMVSAEAHATGVYACNFDGTDGGPAIIQDRAPDSFDPAEGGRIMFQYGGGSATGPIEVTVERPFRASNGEATTYAFNITVDNLDATAHSYSITTQDLPDGWRFVRPNGTLALEQGQLAHFTGYVIVPFQHLHGATSSFDMVVTASDGSAEATAQMGVHYLDVPQPSGHHSTVFLHSVAPLGDRTFEKAAGGGGNPMYWNTLDEDPTDQGLPMANQLDDGALVWYGCLAPRLALGMSPDPNGTGAFDLTFSSDIGITGSLTGAVRIVEAPERGAMCDDAREYDAGTTILELDPVDVAISGTTNVQGTISLAFDKDIPFARGSDLLLEVRITPPPGNTPVGGTVDLQTGGRLELPLADYHEPVPELVLEEAGGETGFVPDETPVKKESPALPGTLLALGVLALARMRR